jgi:hypothetical protein
MLAARVEPKNGRRKSKKTGNFKPLVLVQFQPAVDSRSPLARPVSNWRVRPHDKGTVHRTEGRAWMAGPW